MEMKQDFVARKFGDFPIAILDALHDSENGTEADAFKVQSLVLLGMICERTANIHPASTAAFKHVKGEIEQLEGQQKLTLAVSLLGIY